MKKKKNLEKEIDLQWEELERQKMAEYDERLREKLEKEYHKKLAEYFHEQAFGKDPKLSFSGYDGRGFAELPYHRLMSGNRKEAEKLLTDFTFLMGKARTGLVTEILFDYEMLNE